jgi:hypothetical protein
VENVLRHLNCKVRPLNFDWHLSALGSAEYGMDEKSELMGNFHMNVGGGYQKL